jgi:hypothetical protein
MRKTIIIFYLQVINSIFSYSKSKYSQTCVQRPPLGPEKRGRYAEGYMTKMQIEVFFFFLQNQTRLNVKGLSPRNTQ